jgi:hypothetical protein
LIVSSKGALPDPAQLFRFLRLLGREIVHAAAEVV